MQVEIVSEIKVRQDGRVKQIEGMFDVPPSERSVCKWDVNLPIEEKPWNIGLIVGPSGSGKTTVARNLFGENIVAGYDWDPELAIVSQFPKEMSIQDISGCLSSVGFSSPPSWLRPFSALSNGEQFRVNLARAIAEEKGLFVVDEFTSVVDRTVAQIGSHAVAKAIRRENRQMIAVSCHYDIIEWLQPDWVYEPAVNSFQRRSLRRRPSINLVVEKVHHSAWKLFKKHHYLSQDLHPSCHCFVGSIDGQPVAFIAVRNFPHPDRPMWSGSRLVVLPDFQGVGVGVALMDYVSGVFRGTGRTLCGTFSSPAVVHHIAKSPNWKITRKPSLKQRPSSKSTARSSGSAGNRKTTSFEFVGPGQQEEARAFGLLDTKPARKQSSGGSELQNKEGAPKRARPRIRKPSKK